MMPIILQATYLLFLSLVITGLFAIRDLCHLLKSTTWYEDKMKPRIVSGVWVNGILIAVFTSVQSLSTNCEWQAGVQNLFTNAPLPFLALVVALAAYTSSILTKLRESITDLQAQVRDIKTHPDKDEKGHRRLVTPEEVRLSLQKHIHNYEWLAWADFLLVAAGLLFVVTGFGGTLGEPNEIYQSLCLSLLFTIIGYFAVLHGRQWLR